MNCQVFIKKKEKIRRRSDPPVRLCPPDGPIGGEKRPKSLVLIYGSSLKPCASESLNPCHFKSLCKHSCHLC